MDPTITLFISPLLRELAETAIAERVSGYHCQIRLVEYTDLHELPALYTKYADSCDAIMVYGRIAGAIVRKTAMDQKQVWTFDTDETSFYKCLFKLFLQFRLSPERVFMDYLFPLSDTPSVVYFMDSIEPDHGENDEQLLHWAHEQIRMGIANQKKALLAKIDEAWSRNAFDLLLCNFSTLCPDLKAREIPYQFIHPTKEQIQDEITDLCIRLKLNAMTQNHHDAPVYNAGSSDEPAPDEKLFQLTIDAVHTISSECGLSPLTVRKLADIVSSRNSREITTRELADQMGTTVRYAQKILSILEGKGYAEYAYGRSLAHKGRPSKVYTIHLLK